MPEGVLTEAWQETELGQLGSFSRGRGGTRADEDPTGLPCIRYGDLYTHHDCIVRSFASSISPSSASSYTPLHLGDVVFAGSGETFEDIGKAVAYCNDSPAYAGADTIIFRPGPRLLPQFAGYALNSDCANAYKSRMGQGSSVIHIGAKHLSRMHFRLPPVEQQERIAEILSTVDEAIEQTEALIAKTQQIKAGLMHDIFTRGVTADGQLRPPLDEAPQLYKESALGWIPKDWQAESLANIGTWISGGTPSKTRPSFWGGDLPWITPKDMKVFRLESTHDTLTQQGAASGSRIVPQNSIFVVVRGMILAHTFPVCLATAPMTFNQDIKALVPGALAGGEFLAHWFVASKDYMLGLVTEATHGTKRIDMRDLLRSYIGVPPVLEQQAVVHILMEVDGKLGAAVEEVSKLRDIKSGLMADVLTGRVPVNTDVPSQAKAVAPKV